MNLGVTSTEQRELSTSSGVWLPAHFPARFRGWVWGTSRTFPASLPRSRKNGTTQYKLLPAEAVFANTLGLLILIFGVLVVAALARPSWKRPDPDSPDSRQVWAGLAGIWEAKLGKLPLSTAPRVGKD